MTACRLIICEKTSHWATALRLALCEQQSLCDQQPRLVETRSLTGCDSALVESPASLVALEVTGDNVEKVLEFVVRSRVRFPEATFAALLAADAVGAAPLVREAGAIDAINSILDSQRLARLALRQFSLAPQPELGLRELITERMPWSAHATT
jgi:hypothetical protein